MENNFNRYWYRNPNGWKNKRVAKYLKGTFCLTYGDGLSNVNISESIKFHKKNKKLATITVVQPAGRFGSINLKKYRD